jgi:cytoskeleton protein RodZ
MTTGTTAENFGARLREAREARGVSLQQIASVTKISVGVLEALERNDFSKLPGGIFSRAFVRAYAREVGLDPEETVRRFLAALPPDSAAARVHAPPSLVDQEEAVFESRQRVAAVVLRLVLVSVPVAALLVYLSVGRGSRPAVAPSASPTAMPVAAGVPGSGTGEARADAPTAGDRVSTAGAPVGALEPAVRSTAEPAPAVSPGGGLVLEIAPVGMCWVSLTVDGRLILARIVAPGERIVQTFRQEAALQVGDAGSFAFTINGRAGRSIGARGEVKSLRITRDNYETFLR